jgi:hypothetical protein
MQEMFYSKCKQLTYTSAKLISSQLQTYFKID